MAPLAKRAGPWQASPSSGEDEDGMAGGMADGFGHILNWRLLAGSHPFPGPDGGTCINEAAVVAAGADRVGWAGSSCTVSVSALAVGSSTRVGASPASPTTAIGAPIASVSPSGARISLSVPATSLS